MIFLRPLAMNFPPKGRNLPPACTSINETGAPVSKKPFRALFFLHLFLVVAFASSLTACSKGGGGDDDGNPVTTTPLDPAASDMTVMVYLNADNNLGYFADQDMNEMLQGMQSAESAAASAINLIVQYDGNSAGDSRIYRITPTGRTTLESLGEQNMGDPETLSDFIGYCKASYPADRFALILWDHGDGARAANAEDGSRTISSDETSGDVLLMNEVQQALGAHFSPAEPLGLIGFDACLMGTVEVAYEMKDYARTMAGSMNLEPGAGWNYEAIFENGDQILAGSSNFAALVVDTYRNWVQSNDSNNGRTMSAIDLSQLDALRIAVDGLADAMRTNLAPSGTDHWYAAELARRMTERYYPDNSTLYIESSPYVDLGDLCDIIAGNSPGTFTAAAATAAQTVRTALGNAVIRAFGDSGSGLTAYYGAGSSVQRGLSIFFQQPPYSGDYNYDFANWTQYYDDYNGWYTGNVYSEGSWGSGGQLDFCRDSSWKTFMDYVFESDHAGYNP